MKFSIRHKMVTTTTVVTIYLAEIDVNRTHQRRDTPPIGFEDREPHQMTNYLHVYCVSVLYLVNIWFCVNEKYLCSLTLNADINYAPFITVYCNPI